MSIFVSPVSAVKETDLNELLANRAVENIQLEFKREVPTKDETLKKLSAFANTLGGFLVVGAEANSKDGRISALSGVDPQPNYKQTIAQWCFEGVSPPLDAEVSDPIPMANSSGKVAYLIRVRESDVGPHFLNGRKGVYVRNDEFSARFDSRPANDNELRHLFNRRELVRQRRAALLHRARKRFDTYATLKYGELGRRTKGLGARFDLCIVPRFPSRHLCEQARLRSIVEAKRISWRQVGFPRSSEGFISQHESVICLRPGSSFSFLEANTWGMLFYATEIELETENFEGIHLYHFLGQLLVFLEHAGLVLSEVGYNGPLKLDMKLEALRGAKWVYAEGGFMRTAGPSSELDDDVEFSIETTTQDLQQRRDAVGMDLLRVIFFAVNWPDAVTAPDALAELIRGGYNYNLWQRPANLKM